MGGNVSTALGLGEAHAPSVGTATLNRESDGRRSDLAGAVYTSEGAERAREALRRKARMVGRLKTLENAARARQEVRAASPAVLTWERRTGLHYEDLDADARRQADAEIAELEKDERSV